MGRVFYMRNIVPEQLASYEALGWTLAGSKTFALDEVSLCVAWERGGDPIEPEPPSYHLSLPKPTTRDVVRWNFAPWDLLVIVGLAIAGLAWGVIDWVTGRQS